MANVSRFQGKAILARAVIGQALAADTPMSFWGGFDPATGEIIDRRHPLAGEIATRRILVIPCGRGSCSGSGVLLEAIRDGAAPAAILTSAVDPIIALGAILGDELYGSFPAIVVIDDDHRRQITSGDLVVIDESGWVTVTRAIWSPATDAATHLKATRA